MATKLYNSHLKIIFDNSNSGYILDTYIALVHISCEVNSKYIIQTYNSSKAYIVKLACKYVSASLKTVYNAICELLALNILSYDESLNTWTLVNMENMTKYKDYNEVSLNSNVKNTGYTNIRNFFFMPEFSSMKSREKRLIIYMSQLCDSKARSFHSGFTMNLLKPNSPWLKVLKTKCKYYAKYTIEKMFSKYNNLFKVKDCNVESNLYSFHSNNFKFSFNCPVVENINKENDNCLLVKLNNPNEYLLVKEKIKFAEVTLSKQKIMHLVRSISNIKEWFIKERVVQLIVNKYRAIQVHKSRVDIKSLPAYVAVVVQKVVSEYKEFKNNVFLKNLTNNEIGEYYIESKVTNFNELI